MLYLALKGVNMVEERRTLALQVLDVLKKFTDEKHTLTYSEIAQKLESEYNITISVKTICKIVNTLIDYGMDIVKRGNNGCALLGRYIDNSELAFLIDAIFSSKSISSAHAKELIGCLMKDCSIYERKKFDYIHKADEIVRANNKEFFYTIDTISRAIEDGKQISFTYNEILPTKEKKTRFNGKEFIINPYFMINNHGKYYLVCNYAKYDTIANYKIECISNIKILDTPIRPLNSLPEADGFEITKYVNEHIYMFTGKTIKTTIEIDNPKVINDVVDWYGENIDIKEKNSKTYVSFSVNEQAFLYWALQYGLNIKIIEPKKTREKYIEMLNQIMKKYNEE